MSDQARNTANRGNHTGASTPNRGSHTGATPRRVAVRTASNSTVSRTSQPSSGQPQIGQPRPSQSQPNSSLQPPANASNPRRAPPATAGPSTDAARRAAQTQALKSVPGDDNDLFRSGIEGKNTLVHPHANVHYRKQTMPDKAKLSAKADFTAFAPDDMWRGDRVEKDRREPRFQGLHCLHEDVIKRTLYPPQPSAAAQKRRAEIWDKTATATKQALAKLKLKKGDRLVICANSGPFMEAVEGKHPSELLATATHGLFYVAEFRAKGEVHANWHQVAVPTNAEEGRLLAGVRLLPSIVGSMVPEGVTFHVANATGRFGTGTIGHELKLLWKHEDLQHGSVARSWNPTNLGGWFSRGAVFRNDATVIRNSFAADGDLYGWDEAILYTRNPVCLVASDKKVPHRYDAYTTYGKTYLNIIWLQTFKNELGGLELRGGLADVTRRADVIAWGEGGSAQWPVFKSGATIFSPSSVPPPPPPTQGAQNVKGKKIVGTGPGTGPRTGSGTGTIQR